MAVTRVLISVKTYPILSATYDEKITIQVFIRLYYRR